ncbi:hypothetical protein, partial [Burkholderia multivorans]|uniref:hypothetical protein n=1 Tax=Burkholderia multivorans TaxID=87883 RepID=UPI001ABA5213
GYQLLDEFRVQVQALARLNRHFFLAFAWHKVAPWPSVYASHTKIRIGSSPPAGHHSSAAFALSRFPAFPLSRFPAFPPFAFRLSPFAFRLSPFAFGLPPPAFRFLVSAPRPARVVLSR